MELSFVIYFHSSRLDNLKQMIRLLKRREDVTHSELVLACQDSCDWIPDGFGASRSLSLGLSQYRKPFLCNRGVEASTGRVVALLDSDRVLPANWFSSAADTVRDGVIITSKNLLWCPRPYTDQEIERGNPELLPDPKSPINELLKKNAFSGNTVMLREDYLKVGGMDESFVSYGFADNDMVENCRKHGMTFVFREEPELHLFHDKYVIMDGQPMPRDQFKAYTLLNGLKFCLKWKKQPTQPLLELFKWVKSEGSPLLVEIEPLLKRLRTF